MKKIIETKKAPAPIGPYSQAVESGGFLFCSGQIALDPATNQVSTGGVPEQTELVMKNIAAVLEAANLGFDAVVKTTIFLTDMADFPAVNEIYGKYFKTAPPARSTVAVLGLPKGVKVEVEVLASPPLTPTMTNDVNTDESTDSATDESTALSKSPPLKTDDLSRSSRRRARVVRWLRLSVGGVLALLLGLYVREIHLVLQQPLNSWTEDANADCAVVLTGGPHRIREGVDLLARHAVQKLIISGVNPQASFHEIFPLWAFYGDLRDQDIILERRSRTTFGNAQQTFPLVEALHCRDLLLITSRTHMRRALGTFRAEFPVGFPIVARAVSAGPLDPPWPEIANEAIRSLFYSMWAY